MKFLSTSHQRLQEEVVCVTEVCVWAWVHLSTATCVVNRTCNNHQLSQRKSTVFLCHVTLHMGGLQALVLYMCVCVCVFAICPQVGRMAGWTSEDEHPLGRGSRKIMGGWDIKKLLINISDELRETNSTEWKFISTSPCVGPCGWHMINWGVYCTL